jgi:hypothetical protein
MPKGQQSSGSQNQKKLTTKEKADRKAAKKKEKSLTEPVLPRR